MKASPEIKFVFTSNHLESELPFSIQTITDATVTTNAYLKELPTFFGTSVHSFYSTLNQRNLSGFIGEVFKHALSSIDSELVPNPHPDGRPDVLVIREPEVSSYYDSCFRAEDNAPLREKFAPFQYGGVEIKCSIGNITKASQFDIGDSRVSKVTGITYWAHHAHECNLLGIYYDYCEHNEKNPQIKAITYAKICEDDWNAVSTGRPDSKKTSNTSINKKGVAKLKTGLLMHSDEDLYVDNLQRIRFLP